jgi:NitT/TauT family transport system substrate-binding protein
MIFFTSTRFRNAMGIAALTWGATVMAQVETLRIQDYPGLGNVMVRVAAANGYCEKNGIKCELKTIPAAPLGIQTLLAGDIDVAFGPAEVVIQAANRGPRTSTWSVVAV